MASSKLRKAIRDAGLKQKDLAAALEITEGTVSKILGGKCGVSVDTAARIVEVIRHKTGRRRGITIDALFGKAA